LEVFHPFLQFSSCGFTDNFSGSHGLTLEPHLNPAIFAEFFNSSTETICAARLETLDRVDDFSELLGC
jgi:hypothetical protein